ncbi:MAG: response regulator [Lachnospiraceae bacterium]|nr:response regulator [Lachnospiraceae bacterium]
MFDYVVSYDVAGFVLIFVLSAVYFTRRRFDTAQNRMFSYMVLLGAASVVLDLISVVMLTYRKTVPVSINYIINILYFLITGLVAVMFCIYSLNATNAISNLGSGSAEMLILETPYILYALLILSTPFTHYVFYFDENRDYVQGPFMYAILVMFVIYVSYSVVRISFFNAGVTFRRRFPYYIFASLLLSSIVLQSVFKDYLLYGFAFAIGLILLFLFENNSTDYVDFNSQLFNRSGMRIRVGDYVQTDEAMCTVGFGFNDYLITSYGDDSTNVDYVVNKIGSFLLDKFPDNNVFYLGNYIFAVICPPDGADEAVGVILERFSKLWTLHDGDIKLNIGICKISYPDDYGSTLQLIDAVEKGVQASIDRGGKVLAADDIRHEQERRIKLLEESQEQLREKFDEAEIKMQKALEADKSKTLFLAQMSHEIRTPMTAILGMTELLMRDSNDPKVLDHANAIMSSGKTLVGIINDILDFSKIEAGKLQISCEEYYFTSTFYDILNNVEQRISDKRLDFVVYFDPKLPASFYGDEVRIKQIIINLLTNACKYTEVGQVDLKVFASDFEGDNCILNIVVADTGVGIAQENMGKLFNGFERLGATKNKAIEGTGLGLAITKQLVDAMQGTIEVQSELAKGSTFTVRIPQKIVDSRDSIVIENCDKLRFLIYCGSLNELKNYRATLKDFDITVDYTTNADDLDRKVKENEYSHILLPLGEFDRRVKAKDPLVDDQRVVVGLYYRQYMADVKGHRTINMPISSINLSTLILENTNASKKHESLKSYDYVAPDVDMLVVDDNLVNLRIFVGLLDNHKMRIFTADSGIHCIEMCQRMKYDLIFLDHMMPKKDGIETLHEMREDPSTLNADTPVVAFTANAVSGMRDMFLEQGFSDFLSKPIELAKLEDILSAYLPEEKIITVKSDMAAYNEIVNRKEENLLEVTSVSDGDDGSFVIEGIDMEQALFYSGNSYETLKNVLEVFLSDGKNKLDLLVKYVEEEDYDNYRIEIHAVKSLCKGIGAMELSEKARRLEEACKQSDHDYVRANAQEAYTDYVMLLGRIEEALSGLKEKDRAKSSSASGTEAEPILDVGEQLLCAKLLLAEFEGDAATKLIKDLIGRSGLAEDMKNAIEEIDKKLALYDYDGAAEKIEELL